MSAFARTLAAVVLAILMSVVAMCQTSGVQSENPAEQSLAEAIKGEKLSESGRLCFQIRIEGDEGSTPTRKKEAKDVDRVEYSWAPGGKFRIAMISKTGPLREIVSDGKVISADGKIWDARFAWDYNPHGTDDSERLVAELDDSMWVYSRVLNLHLHPLTWFRNVRTLDTYSSLYQISMKDSGANATANVGASVIELRYRSNHNAYEFRQIQSSEFTYVRANQPAGSMPQGFAFERADPVKVAGVGWALQTCLVTMEPTRGMPKSPFRWISELCPDQPAQAIDPAEFVIKYKASDVIPWPYGSHVKNYWYAVVNTFKDMWEGISDGIIGD